MLQIGSLVLMGWVPAVAGPSLHAAVVVYTPDHSGSVPLELQPARAAFERNGFTGATLTDRVQVTLDRGVLVHVDLGSEELGLELLSVANGTARVRIVRESCPATVASVEVGSATFHVVVEKRRPRPEVGDRSGSSSLRHRK